MAQFLSRNPIGNQQGGFSNPNGGPSRYLELQYGANGVVGPQEWIYAPDAGRWAVTIFFLNGPGSAFIEGTDMSPFDLQGIDPENPLAPQGGSYMIYPLTDIVSDTTRVIVQCCSAVRINVLGGTVNVTACC